MDRPPARTGHPQGSWIWGLTVQAAAIFSPWGREPGAKMMSSHSLDQETPSLSALCLVTDVD